jgi:hypothetical protein
MPKTKAPSPSLFSVDGEDDCATEEGDDCAKGKGKGNNCTKY